MQDKSPAVPPTWLSAKEILRDTSFLEKYTYKSRDNIFENLRPRDMYLQTLLVTLRIISVTKIPDIAN